MSRLALAWLAFLVFSSGLVFSSSRAFDQPTETKHSSEAPMMIVGTQTTSAGPGNNAARAISYERLRQSANEPWNWLTYSGDYNSQRHSPLKEISRDNVHRLRLKWVHQLRTLETVETTPLVVDGVMYLTHPSRGVTALDTKTGRPFWEYDRPLPDQLSLCCAKVNRGLAILGETLFMGTLDAYLVALDAKTGSVRWNVAVGEYIGGFSITAAPLAVKGMIITGVAGGDFGIRGFLDAYDAKSGQRRWRFYTIPGPGEPGNETWAGDSWKTGGGPTWMTGSFDPELNLIYWGVGNPAPVWNGEVRKGDNLYTDSVVALDADTGELKWFFQFTPHDLYDWDANQIPVLVDAELRGRQRKLMLWANRNGFFYVLDRQTGEFLLARAFAKQSWAEGVDAKGRPIVKPDSVPSFEGTLLYPGAIGATNWWSPSYSPTTGLFYVSAYDHAAVYHSAKVEKFVPGRGYSGGYVRNRPNEDDVSAVRALIPETGEVRWEYRLHAGADVHKMSGLLTTAGNLLFGGHKDGHFFALDAFTGRELWHINTGGKIAAAPITYLSNGRQLVSIAAGSAIFTFGLER